MKYKILNKHEITKLRDLLNTLKLKFPLSIIIEM